MPRTGWVVGAVAALTMAGTAAAQQLDPRVAGPLMQLMQGAQIQCQAGNPQACAMIPQFEQAGQELFQAQVACQQGNPQACQVFQMGAQQVMAAWQQNFGGMPQAPAYSPQQQSWDHQQRMQQQQMQFQQHQQRMQQQQQMQDQQHQRFMEQLRR